MCTGVEIAALVVAAAGTASSVENSRRAASQQHATAELQKNSQEAADAEMRRQRVREERVKRAQILQLAEGTGTTASSGAIGATDSLTTQVGSSFAFQTGQAQAASDIGAEQQGAANSMFHAQVAGTVGGLGAQVFMQGSSFKSLFGP